MKMEWKYKLKKKKERNKISDHEKTVRSYIFNEHSRESNHYGIEIPLANI